MRNLTQPGPGLARHAAIVLAWAALAAPGAAQTSAAPIELVGVETFVATPRAGVRVTAIAFYARADGPDLVSRHAYQTRSDTADVAFVRYSLDHGATWSKPTRVATHTETERGTKRRYLRAGFADPDAGKLVTMILEGVLPGDDPLEGMKHWTLRYALSADGGRTVEHEAPVVHRGDGFTPAHPLPGVWIGRNSVMIGDAACAPIKLPTGELLQPVQITPLGPDGEYHNPGGGYTFHDAAVLIGRWNDAGTLDWELSSRVRGDPARSTRGFLEPTIAAMADGRILMVLRGSNDAKPSLPGRRWFSVSEDRGNTWSDPEPWTYAKGTDFFSPSSCSQLLRHSNGRTYWIGNISPENPRGNHPRHPLVIGEVDPRSLKLLRDTLCVVDDRRADDPARLQISNFFAREDRESHEIVVHCTPFPRPHPRSKLAEKPTSRGLDWTADARLYRLAVPLR